jgi:hypothetical protein
LNCIWFLKKPYDIVDHWGADLEKACGSGYVQNHTSAHTDHCWGDTDAEVDGRLRRWADTIVGPMRKAGFKKLAQISLDDELAWHYPGFWEDTNAITGKPRLVKRYKEYLINNSGFATPQDFGADSWKAVVPAPAHGVANLKHPTVNSTLTARRAFYWSIRFGTWDTEAWFARATAALVAANDGESFQIYTNWK